MSVLRLLVRRAMRSRAQRPVRGDSGDTPPYAESVKSTTWKRSSTLKRSPRPYQWSSLKTVHESPSDNIELLYRSSTSDGSPRLARQRHVGSVGPPNTRIAAASRCCDCRAHLPDDEGHVSRQSGIALS